jgi:hypothetical protein
VKTLKTAALLLLVALVGLVSPLLACELLGAHDNDEDATV